MKEPTKKEIFITSFLSGLILGGFVIVILHRHYAPEPTECSIFTEQKRCESAGGDYWVGMDYDKWGKVLQSCHSKSVDLFSDNK